MKSNTIIVETAANKYEEGYKCKSSSIRDRISEPIRCMFFVEWLDLKSSSFIIWGVDERISNK